MGQPYRPENRGKKVNFPQLIDSRFNDWKRAMFQMTTGYIQDELHEDDPLRISPSEEDERQWEEYIKRYMKEAGVTSNLNRHYSKRRDGTSAASRASQDNEGKLTPAREGMLQARIRGVGRPVKTDEQLREEHEARLARREAAAARQQAGQPSTTTDDTPATPALTPMQQAAKDAAEQIKRERGEPSTDGEETTDDGQKSIPDTREDDPDGIPLTGDARVALEKIFGGEGFEQYLNSIGDPTANGKAALYDPITDGGKPVRNADDVRNYIKGLAENPDHPHNAHLGEVWNMEFGKDRARQSVGARIAISEGSEHPEFKAMGSPENPFNELPDPSAPRPSRPAARGTQEQRKSPQQEALEKYGYEKGEDGSEHPEMAALRESLNSKLETRHILAYGEAQAKLKELFGEELYNKLKEDGNLVDRNGKIIRSSKAVDGFINRYNQANPDAQIERPKLNADTGDFIGPKLSEINPALAPEISTDPEAIEALEDSMKLYGGRGRGSAEQFLAKRGFIVKNDEGDYVPTKSGEVFFPHLKERMEEALKELASNADKIHQYAKDTGQLKEGQTKFNFSGSPGLKIISDIFKEMPGRFEEVYNSDGILIEGMSPNRDWSSDDNISPRNLRNRLIGNRIGGGELEDHLGRIDQIVSEERANLEAKGADAGDLDDFEDNLRERLKNFADDIQGDDPEISPSQLISNIETESSSIVDDVIDNIDLPEGVLGKQLNLLEDMGIESTTQYDEPESTATFSDRVFDRPAEGTRGEGIQGRLFDPDTPSDAMADEEAAIAARGEPVEEPAAEDDSGITPVSSLAERRGGGDPIPFNPDGKTSEELQAQMISMLQQGTVDEKSRSALDASRKASQQAAANPDSTEAREKAEEANRELQEIIERAQAAAEETNGLEAERAAIAARGEQVDALGRQQEGFDAVQRAREAAEETNGTADERAAIAAREEQQADLARDQAEFDAARTPEALADRARKDRANELRRQRRADQRSAREKEAEWQAKSPQEKRLDKADELGLLQHILDNDPLSVDARNIDELKEELAGMDIDKLGKFLNTQHKSLKAAQEKQERAEQADREKEDADAEKTSADAEKAAGRTPAEPAKVFNRDKTLKRLARLQNPDLEEGSDELNAKVAELSEHYDPETGFTDKDIQDALKAQLSLTANQEAQQSQSRKARLQGADKLRAVSDFEDNFPEPSEDMSPEEAKQRMRELTDFQHRDENFAHFGAKATTDPEHYKALRQRLNQYEKINPSAAREIAREIQSAAREGIDIGSDEFIEHANEGQKKADIQNRKNEARNTHNQSRLEEALREGTFDRSTDSKGNAVRNRLDSSGNHEHVEDDAVHEDGTSPRVHATNDEGYDDPSLQALVDKVHEAKLASPKANRELDKALHELMEASNRKEAESVDTHTLETDGHTQKRDAAHEQLESDYAAAIANIKQEQSVDDSEAAKQVRNSHDRLVREGENQIAEATETHERELAEHDQSTEEALSQHDEEINDLNTQLDEIETNSKQNIAAISRHHEEERANLETQEMSARDRRKRISESKRNERDEINLASSNAQEKTEYLSSRITDLEKSRSSLETEAASTREGMINGHETSVAEQKTGVENSIAELFANAREGVSQRNRQHGQRRAAATRALRDGRKRVNEDHRVATEDSDQRLATSRKEASDGHLESYGDLERAGNEADEVSRGRLAEAIQALKEHPDMVKDPQKLAAILGHSGLGESAESKEQAHTDSEAGEDRDGKPKQTRMVPDSKNPPDGMKKQVWIPGRGKGWVDADKMDASNAEGAEAAKNGKMTIYPEGHFDAGHGAEGDEDFRPPSAPMASYAGNLMGIEHSGHPDWQGADGQPHHDDNLDHSGVVGRHLGSHPGITDHENFTAGGAPFQVDPSDLGMPNIAEHLGEGKGSPRKAETVGGRAVQIGGQIKSAASQAKVSAYAGASNWLKTKFEAATGVEGEKPPTAVERLANAMRSGRQEGRKQAGGAYYGGMKPKNTAHAKIQDEIWRRTPKALRSLYAAGDPEHARRLSIREKVEDDYDRKSSKKELVQYLEANKEALGIKEE